jgi:hypothetical protein
MKRSRIITFCLAALILTICSPTQGAGQSIDPNRERAIALWEEAVRAKGGRERLHSIQNFLISSTVDVWAQTDRERAILAKASRDQLQSSQNFPIFSTGDVWFQIASGETQTERLYVGPGKAWIYRYTPGFDVSLDAIVINRDRNFCWVTLAPKAYGVPGLSPCIPSTPIQYLVQDPIIYLMETNWLRPEPIGVRTEGKGKKQIDVIETKVGMIRVDFYLDRKTRLPIKLVTDWYGGLSQATGHLGPMTVELRKYVEIDGIQMPGKVSRERDGEGRGPVGEANRLDTERAAYQFNVTYDPKIFESPVPKTVKRRDWKMEAHE